MEHKTISRLLEPFEKSIVKQIEIICKAPLALNYNSYYEIFYRETRLRKISFHSHDVDERHLVLGEGTSIYSFRECLKNFPSPKVDFGYFFINFPFYIESVTKNSFYNKKLFTDVEGFLKFSPYSDVKIGHADKIDLIEVASLKKIQYLWNGPKSMIDVCKDCEFRNMCLDSRLPVSTISGRRYHISECSYNPYICKWRGEEGYASLGECGIIVNESGMNIQEDVLLERINEIYGNEN